MKQEKRKGGHRYQAATQLLLSVFPAKVRNQHNNFSFPRVQSQTPLNSRRGFVWYRLGRVHAMSRIVFKLGKSIYNLKNPKERRRWLAFQMRTLLHYSGVSDLYSWFQSDPERQEMLRRYPYPIEQVQRRFFYAGASFRERSELIRNHVSMASERFLPEVAMALGTASGSYRIWSAPDEGTPWTVEMTNMSGNRKEGMLTLVMRYGEIVLYQMMFWLGPDQNREEALWIGALQGPNTEDACDLIRETTKRAFTFRTKNLILYILMAVARCLRVKHIYAVSFKGYYAYARRDHKLKTDLDSFWQEAGGHLLADERFYEIPLTAPRKPIEEVPSKKRAAYRRRFAFLDDADEQVLAGMGKLLKD